METPARELSTLDAVDRVRAHSPAHVNRRVDTDILDRLRACADAGPEAIERRLREIDREWDIERSIMLQAAVTALTGLVLGLRSDRRWFWLTAVNQVFLLQHVGQGWCPPVSLQRRLGFRTRREIDVERAALKALRGDFHGADTPQAALAAASASVAA